VVCGNPVGCDLMLVLLQKRRCCVVSVPFEFVPHIGRHAVLQLVLHMGVERFRVVAFRPEILGIIAAAKLKTVSADLKMR
jgi:hypothetical protein